VVVDEGVAIKVPNLGVKDHHHGVLEKVEHGNRVPNGRTWCIMPTIQETKLEEDIKKIEEEDVVEEEVVIVQDEVVWIVVEAKIEVDKEEVEVEEIKVL
jgi:hypothetical protein